MISTSPEGPRFTRSTLPAKTGRAPSTSTSKRFSTGSTRDAPGGRARGAGRAGEPLPCGLPREERRHGRLDLPALEKEKAGKPHRVLPGEPGEHLPGRPARVPPSLSFRGVFPDHPQDVVDEHPHLRRRKDQALLGFLGGRETEQAVEEIPVGAHRQLFQRGGALDGGRGNDGPRTRKERPSLSPCHPLREDRRDAVPGYLAAPFVRDGAAVPGPEGLFPCAYGPRAGKRRERFPGEGEDGSAGRLAPRLLIDPRPRELGQKMEEIPGRPPCRPFRVGAEHAEGDLLPRRGGRKGEEQLLLGGVPAPERE